jgi:hypothetical protein
MLLNSKNGLYRVLHGKAADPCTTPYNPVGSQKSGRSAIGGPLRVTFSLDASAEDAAANDKQCRGSKER